jgi:replicative DNA helicase
MSADHHTPPPWPKHPTAEAAFLGLCIREPDWLDHVDVNVNLFDDQRYLKAYKQLSEMRQQSQPIDLLSAGAVIGKSLAAELAIAGEDCVGSAVLPILMLHRRKRDLVRIGDALVREGTIEGQPDHELLDIMDERLHAVMEAHAVSNDVIESPVLYEQYLTRLKARSAGVCDGLATGFRRLDRFTGGLPLGQLTVLAARTSVGKSAFSHQVTRATAKTGKHVLVCSAEMGRWEVVERMVAQELGIPTEDLRDGQLEGQWERLGAYSIPRFTVFDASTMTVVDIGALVRRRHGQRPLDLLLIDHLGYLADPPRAGEVRAVHLGRLTKALKAIARRTGCAVLLVSQLNRQSEEGEKMRRPGLADLRDSGEIEQDADMVLFLHRETRAAIAGELIVAKARNGPTGIIPIGWQPGITAWREA